MLNQKNIKIDIFWDMNYNIYKYVCRFVFLKFEGSKYNEKA